MCLEKHDGENLEIEHFESKKTNPSKAFRWSNLFLACGTCNRTKGSQELHNYLKPDIDDPAEYLFINPILLRVEPRPDISDEAKERAKTTIDLYGLNRPELTLMYKYYWRNAALNHVPVPPPYEITLNSDEPWIGEYIRDNLPEVERRAKPPEEYSLMAKSLIDFINKNA